MPPKPKAKSPIKSGSGKVLTGAPKTIVVWGESGMGKTSWCAQWPRCGFICDEEETGVTHLTNYGLIPEPVWVEYIPNNPSLDTALRAWPTFLERIQVALNDKRIDTLVLESLTGIESIALAYHCMDSYDGREGPFWDYARGPKTCSKNEWPKLLHLVNAGLKRGKSTLITAHAYTREDTDPSGAKFHNYTPYVERHIWQRTHRWATAVFLFRYQTSSVQRGTRSIGTKQSRVVNVESSPQGTAKNLYGLNGVFSLGSKPKDGFDNFCKALR